MSPAMTWAARPARPRCRARMAAISRMPCAPASMACFPVHNPALCRLHPAGPAAWHQGHRRFRAGRLDRRARRGPGDPAHRAAAGRAQHRRRPPSWRRVPRDVATIGATIAGMQFSGLTSDSRKVQPGFLFAALCGSKTDGASSCTMRWRAAPPPCWARRRWKAKSRRWACASFADANPRLRLAKFAAAFYGAQPDVVAAVTGTKGKSSIVAFMREIWTRHGHSGRSAGHRRRDHAQGRDAAEPHHARSGGNSCPAGAAESRRRRSPGDRGVQPWPGPAPAGWRR